MFSSFRRPLPVAALLLLLLAIEPLARAQSQPNVASPAAARQITGPIDENRLQTLPGNMYPLARREFDHGRVPDSSPQQHILMMLKRSPERESALQQFMQEQYNPQSPNFHKWLTPEQFGSLFGPSTEDIHLVTQWLGQRGFTVNSVAPGGVFIDFSGTAGEVTSAFHTEVHRYRVNGEDHLANASDPAIPTALAPVVSGFRALNDFHPKPVLHNPGLARLDPATGRWSRLSPGHLTVGEGANASYLVGPQDFAKIYGVNQVWAQAVTGPSGRQKLVGAGQTIGVVGDTDLASGDIASFRDQFGVSALGPNGSVVVDHPPANVCPAPDPNANDPEGYLDAEWSGAMAPDATVDFVACGNEGVTAGADLAAAYIVEDPAHAAQDGVISSSFGFCEQDPLSESNQFYVQLWQQAAAEGITVVVAAGDSGGAECDEFTGVPYATQGFGVNAEASTPYNIAAGGTDFSDVFSGTTRDYWSAANKADLASAKSYIPEMAWNDSCASPLVLQAFGNGFTSSSGPDGFCTYASEQPPDPYTGFSSYFLLFAGSGGLSTVSPRPSWQTGVDGIPAGNARALPDISMFASSGDAWGHTLLLCDSALLPAGSSCDFSNPNDVLASTDGGTSFVAPAFAGIMALIEQKSGSRQGQANNILYPLAGEQYINSEGAREPNLATCAAYLGPNVLPSCYFHDISATPNPDPATQKQIPFLTGTTSVPCTGTATQPGVYTDASADPASNSEDCFGYQITVTSNDGVNTTVPNYYGVLSTADNANSPAFPATPGYDLATGLGSPNVEALVNAPQWSSGALLTVVNLTPQTSTITRGQNLLLTATVTVQQGGAPVKSGSVTFFSGNTPLGSASLRCAGKGFATLSVPGSAFGPDGVYNDVYAVYSGGADSCGRGGAVYFGSTSNTVTVNVALASATITASPVYPAAECCFFNQSTPLDVLVTGGASVAPTGNVQVQFNGITIGSGALAATSQSASSTTVLVDDSTLAAGNNPVSLVYPGDPDYMPAQGQATITIRSPAVPFGLVAVGSMAEINVPYTFVVAGTITLNFNPAGAASTDFSIGRRGSCRSGTREPAGTICTIGIVFQPSQPGLRKGAVEVSFRGAGGSGASTPLYLFPSGIGGVAQISLSAMTQVTLNSSLNQPQSTVFDPTGKTLLVANSAAGQIVTVPPGGGAFTPINLGNVTLVYPTDLTFDGFGDLLAADAYGGDVFRFPPAGNGQAIATGSVPLVMPTAIRTDGAGNLYIADPGQAKLIEVPTQGAAPSIVNLGGVSLSYPQGLALDNAGANLYIADGNTNQIVLVPLDNPDSASVVNISPCAASITTCSLNNPSGVAFDLNGDMYIVDAAHFRVLMVPRTHAAGGTPTTVLPITGLLNASSVTVDASGNLYVPDIVDGALYKLLVASGAVNFNGQTGTSIPVTVTNTGNENLRITGLNFAQGRDFGETDNCTRTTIAPGGGCTINIRFKKSTGTAEDTLSITSNAVSSAAIAITGGSAPSAAGQFRR